MIARIFAGVGAVLFVAFVERASLGRRRTRSALLFTLLPVVIAIALAVPILVSAADLIPEGTIVRAQSGYIDAGWHEGTLRRGGDKCWMVFLRKPATGGYTAIALMAVSRLQVARGTQWADAVIAHNLKAQPAVCMEEGAG